jgi:hypothetical protein
LSVLRQLVDHYRKLREHTAQEIAMIEAGKLVILRHGRNGTAFWRVELQDRLAKIDRVLEAFDNPAT